MIITKLKIKIVRSLLKLNISYLAESISLLRDSKSDVDLLKPGCIPMLLENNSKTGCNFLPKGLKKKKFNSRESKNNKRTKIHTC